MAGAGARSRWRRCWLDTFTMADGTSYAGMSSMLVVQGANIALLAKVLQQQKRDGKKKPPADSTIAKRYAKYAPFQGLAMWLDLTAPWHGE